MALIHQYIIKIVAQNIALTLAVLLAIYGIFNFLNQIDKLGIGDFDLLSAGVYVLQTLPFALQDVLPMIIMIGVMLGVGQLINSREWVAIRSIGMSNVRLVGVVVMLGMAVIVLSTVLSELFVYQMYQSAQQQKDLALGRNVGTQQNRHNTWLVKDDKFIHLNTDGVGVSAVSVLEIKNNTIQTIISSNQVDYRAHKMQLNMAEKTSFSHDSRDQKQRDRFVINTDFFLQKDAHIRTSTTTAKYEIFPVLNLDVVIATTTLANMSIIPEYLNTQEVWLQINYLQSHGISHQDYEIVLYHRLSKPLLLLAIMFLGLFFILNTDRDFNLGKYIFIGIIFSFTLYIISRLSAQIALAFNYNIALSILLPAILLLLVSLLLLRNKIYH